MKRMYGYIRVSTPKQGKGVSLIEQKSAIETLAQKNNYKIVKWFCEKQTAAKRGRVEFEKCLKLLKERKADGLVTHKIDRSARNLHDWADLGDLYDHGFEVTFAGEDVDLGTPGGRLSADIKAVVAADFVRNLKAETRKGVYGRLKQGLYPLRAPIGYLDTGQGKVKAIDTQKAHLIKRLFELYATDRFTIESLSEQAGHLGLKNHSGGPITIAMMHRILRNPFYVGIMRIGTTGESFTGVHTHIVSTDLFQKVQSILSGGRNPNRRKHDYLFRRFIRCHGCNRYMVGEMQKGNVYYRCHNRNCETKTVREDRCDVQIRYCLGKLTIPDKLYTDVRANILAHYNRKSGIKSEIIAGKTLQLGKVNTRIDRLADAYLDGMLDHDLLTRKKEQLLLQKTKTEREIEQISSDGNHILTILEEKLELLKSPEQSYIHAAVDEKRDFLEKVGSNFFICGKKVLFEPKAPFDLPIIACNFTECTHSRKGFRKMDGRVYTEQTTPDFSKVPPRKLKRVLIERYINLYCS